MASPSSSKRSRLSGQPTSPPQPSGQAPIMPSPFGVATAEVGLASYPSQPNPRKRHLSLEVNDTADPSRPPGTSADLPSPEGSAKKKARTNTPWTAAEEQRLKTMRDAGLGWREIAKSFPGRTEGSVKKHWYKDMHYAEFSEDEAQALREAIREYEANKWKNIGQKVGKPAKACEQYAKENFKN